MSDPAIDPAYAKPLSKVLSAVASRGAVLFLGSGFSRSAIGLDDQPLLVADALAQQIGKMGNFDAEGDLRYASDRFLRGGGSKQTLIEALQEAFTVKSVAPHHVAIASAPWRRIYTTNYDDCLERAATQADRLIHTVDTSAKPSEYGAKNNVCVHLNGSLNSLSADSLEDAFKLTTSSYLSPDSFLTSQWSYPFQRDLEFCSAIVFVGYSMYDIEVQKILHTSPEYADKTFFIESELRGGKAQFTLEQFGTILPIGAERFGAELANASTHFEAEPEGLFLASLEEYIVRVDPVEIRDKDVEGFLMRGDLDDALIDAATAGANGAPILIPRDELTRALELLKSGSDLIVTGDFGNGKSVFLRALRSRMALQGMRVFSADQADAHQLEDIAQLVRKAVKGFLFIDAYEQNLDLVMTYAELAPSNLRLICGARTSVHERHRDTLVAAGIRASEISVDELSDDEVDDFVRIVDNVGYWGDRAGLSLELKRRWWLATTTEGCP
ncbi:MAG: SIR2 family protein [Xanthomonadales bacterium]|nr:SIR2 family protein [Xanthomonadales bacterium]